MYLCVPKIGSGCLRLKHFLWPRAWCRAFSRRPPKWPGACSIWTTKVLIFVGSFYKGLGRIYRKPTRNRFGSRRKGCGKG